MLVGEYIHTLDEKKRVSLPAKFRTELGKKMVITRGLDGCLFIYSEYEWVKFANKLTELSVAQSDSRAFNRYMLGGAVEVEIDSAGRILIPDFLKEFANLGQRVVMAGVMTRVEVWNEDAWKLYTGDLVGRADVLAEKLGEIGMI